MTEPLPGTLRAAREIAVEAHRIYGQRDNRETEGYDGALAEFAQDAIERESGLRELVEEVEQTINHMFHADGCNMPVDAPHCICGRNVRWHALRAVLAKVKE